jgi:hypothetical protein
MTGVSKATATANAHNIVARAIRLGVALELNTICMIPLIRKAAAAVRSNACDILSEEVF